MSKKKTKTAEKIYKPGDLIFGKLRGYSPWPGRVDSELGTKCLGKYLVFFYGTSQMGMLHPRDIYPYDEFKNKFSANNKSIDFVKGISELEYVQQERKRTKTNNNDKIETKGLSGLPELELKMSVTPTRVSEEEFSEKTPPIINWDSFESDTPDPSPLKKKIQIKDEKSKNKKIPAKTFKRRRVILKESVPSPKRKNISENSTKISENIPKIPKIKKKSELTGDSILKNLDLAIKDSLRVSDPDVEKCIETLNQLMTAQFDAKSLLKYCEIISTIKKVRKYKGSQKIRDLADKVMIKLKDISRSLDSKDFNRIFPTIRLFSTRGTASKEIFESPMKKEEEFCVGDFVSLAEDREEKNRIRIAATIAQIVHESKVDIPEDVNMNGSRTSPLPTFIGRERIRSDAMDDIASLSVVDDDDIHKMLGV